jgi:integrase
MIEILADAGLSPKTINTYTAIVKTVVSSAVDEEGEEIHPRKWNHDFVDMPVVKKTEQNTPSFSAAVVTALAAWKKLRERVLFILCAATGLRIGEALGIEIDKHISEDFSVIRVRQKVRHGRLEQRLKTENAYRDIDIHPLVTKVLKDFVGTRTKGFLFCTRTGKPLGASNVPALAFVLTSFCFSVHSVQRKATRSQARTVLPTICGSRYPL